MHGFSPLLLFLAESFGNAVIDLLTHIIVCVCQIAIKSVLKVKKEPVPARYRLFAMYLLLADPAAADLEVLFNGDAGSLDDQYCSAGSLACRFFF